MEKTEFTPTSSYFMNYVNLAGTGISYELLERSLDQAVEVLKGIGNAEAEEAYAPGKWTIKEVLSHIIDTERVFTYRALCIARGDETILPSFDHVAYVDHSDAMNRSMIDIVFEFMTVRNASISLFKSLSDEALVTKGKFGQAELTSEEIAKVIVGHGKHHLQVIEETYLKS